MDENKIYDPFLKSLRVGLTNVSVYFREHPVLIKSIEDLKAKINNTFPILNPIKFGITPTSLLFGDKIFDKERLYNDIAGFFHYRKVKSIEIKPGVTTGELIDFLIQVNLSPQDIFKKGGVENILEEKKVTHIVLEELDYSQLLKGEGQECKDIWFYLLKKNLKGQGSLPIETLADDFGKVLANIKTEDLLSDEETGTSINQFFARLKAKDKDKFYKCARGLTRLVAKSGNISKENVQERLKVFFNDLEADDFSGMLLEELERGEELNTLSIKLFSKLLDKDQHERFASSLADKIKKEEYLKNNPKFIKGIKDLISLPDAPNIAQIYRRNLSEIIEGISLDGRMVFDRKQLENNYSLCLLDLFIIELDPDQLEAIIDNIFEECEKNLQVNNFKYLKIFTEALDKKRRENSSLTSVFLVCDKAIANFIERAVFSKETISDFEYFLGILKSSTLALKDYFTKIFDDSEVNFYILSLFFKFFKHDTTSFCENLNRKISDMVFMKKLMETLEKINCQEVIEVFKYIFYSSNNFIKIEVLKTMRSLSYCDEDFLFTILESSGFMQRRLAFLILAKYSQYRKRAAGLLLDVSNPFGVHGRVIKENLKIVEEALFNEAEEYLLRLTKYRFFWNWDIKKKAKELLNKFNA